MDGELSTPQSLYLSPRDASASNSALRPGSLDTQEARTKVSAQEPAGSGAVTVVSIHQVTHNII